MCIPQTQILVFGSDRLVAPASNWPETSSIPAKTQAIPAGGVAIMQPKMNHFAWTKEETILQVHGVGPRAVNYVDPADDPRKK